MADVPKSTRNDDKPTLAICKKCGKTAIKGGPIRPDESFIRRVDQCSFGDGWAWCATDRHFQTGCDP